MTELIITHAGSAHFDEMMAIALILACHPGKKFRIERRDPSQQELENPDVWVVDVGGRHQPQLRNFDHHQDLDIAASYVLVGDFLDITEKMRYFYWWKLKDRLDRFGPVNVGESLGIDNFSRLQSPVESWFIDLFAGNPNKLRPLLRSFGKNLLSLGERIAKGIEFWAGCRQIEINGHTVIVGLTEESVGLQEFRDAMPVPASAYIAFDKRGEGWRFYRFNDCEGVNFSSLADHPEIKFVHHGGFVAKTWRRIPVEDALALMAGGLQPVDHHNSEQKMPLQPSQS